MDVYVCEYALRFALFGPNLNQETTFVIDLGSCTSSVSRWLKAFAPSYDSGLESNCGMADFQKLNPNAAWFTQNLRWH